MILLRSSLIAFISPENSVHSSNDIYVSIYIYNFASAVFFRNSRLYCKKLVIMIQSIVHRWPLLSLIFRVAYESRVEKTSHLLRLSTNRSNFLLLHKTESAGQPGRVPLIETSYSQRENVWRIRRVG